MTLIVPPATIGMLGGGQLGRYAIIAARIMGYRTIVLDPDPEAPAARVADVHLVAGYDDPAANDQLARECQVVTTEFENPPASALERLAGRTTVRPAARAVAIAQDRVAEKQFLIDCGVPVGPYDVIDRLDAPITVSFPARLKTARLGYDGKGQRVVRGATELSAVWTDFGSVTCVLEQALSLDQELSVVCARSAAGEFAAYPVAENVHVDGVLDISVVPARTTAELAEQATMVARTIADELEYVGVLAVEFFVVDGELLVNELAPR
ncbi:MAG TPA: ATP-grasp domain-containing protein, partial [Ilumatobacter sp.]|nr:ATP-grasp domain-containing protein [Ilumatobacter sp.]